MAAALLLALAAGACGPAEPPAAEGPLRARVETCIDLIQHLDRASMKPNGADGEVRVEERSINIANTNRPAIYAHPFSEVIFTLPIHPGARLVFDIGLDPGCWDGGGDGVTFEVAVDRETVFSRHIDPGHNPGQRSWQSCTVDLGACAGTDRKIVLRTTAGPADDPAWDWALWGEPQLFSDGRRAPADTAGRTHVILISLDTLRLDHLDASGYHRRTMPHLNRLLEESILFTGAIAPSHWTMPSHMSVFTSLHPDLHRVNTLDGTARLSSGAPTLAAQLQTAGYLTAGFATCGFLKGDLGFEIGFDRYSLRFNDGLQQNRLVRDWLWSRRDRDQFIFLHYFDAHSDYITLPYDAPSGFDALWSELEPEQVFSGCAPDGSICASIYLTRLNATDIQLEPEQCRAIGVMYDRGVRQLDFRLGLLVAWLKAQGLWDSSLVVLFSDHGEEFQDHGKLMHHQLYNESLAVPLIVKLPEARQGGRRIDEPVEILDVSPTILSLLGRPIPELMQGRSLVPLIEGKARQADGAMARYSWAAESWSVTRGQWKLVLHTKDGVFSLFNLEEDPGERHDLSREKPDICNQLQRLLRLRLQRNQDLARQLDTTASAPAEGGFSEEERKRLEALGYVE